MCRKMVANQLLSFSVILVLLVTNKSILSQVDVGTDTTTQETESAASDIICTVCACADSVVDCNNRNISLPFDRADWDGLKSFNPTTVDLSQNPLNAITRVTELPIQVLNISGCSISSMEDFMFVHLKDLAALDLSRNKISASTLSRKTFCGPIDKKNTLRDFIRMRSLSLAYNDIHSLPVDLFVFMTRLTKLDLSGNPLGSIDQVTLGTMSDLIDLTDLKLRECELKTLPEGLLRRQRKLRKLDLSGNYFTTIPPVLGEAPSLMYLNLDNILLQSLEANNALSNLNKIQVLQMSGLSRLQNISAGALGGLPNLVTLRLSNNPKLTVLDPGFLMWKNEDGEEIWPVVKELYLNGNNLSGIDSGILDTWPELQTGDFSGNPYDCDCKNQWMVDVLVPLLKNTPADTSISNMVCKKPSDLRGLTFAQLHNMSKILVCPESQNITDAPEPNMAILVGFLIGIMVTFPVVLILVLLWRRGFFSKIRAQKHYPKDYYDETEDL